MTRTEIETLAIETMRFVMVTISREDGKVPGHLTEISCKLLLVELDRSGLTIEPTHTSR